jgi:hypothetical protein
MCGAGSRMGLVSRLGSILFLSCLGSRAGFAASPPSDNPIATFYRTHRPEAGYPAWTERICWERVIDMQTFREGENDFERFERARDLLAAQGGRALLSAGYL